MSKRISKRKIKSFIKWAEEKLSDKEKEVEEMQNENEKSNSMLYDLTEEYLREERLRGQIDAAYYILKNC